jgi:hypothetical protein
VKYAKPLGIGAAAALFVLIVVTLLLAPPHRIRICRAWTIRV